MKTKPQPAGVESVAPARNRAFGPSTMLTRRSAVMSAVSCVSAAVVASSSIADAGTVSDVDAEINTLWRERLGLISRYRQNNENRRAARRQLPDWALEGHEAVLEATGNPCGPIVGWPALRPGEIKHALSWVREDGTRAYLVRPSSHSIKGFFENHCRCWAEDRAKWRAKYRASMKAFVVRLREKRALVAKVGLDQITAKGDRLIEAILDIESRMSQIPPTPTSIAAVLLIEVDHSASGSERRSYPRDGALQIAEKLLMQLWPQLKGDVADAAAEFLEDGDRPMWQLSYSNHVAPEAEVSSTEAQTSELLDS